MNIEYDSDAVPDLDPALIELADEWRLHPIVVTCDEAGARVGDPGGLSFVALAAFAPRRGDRIGLEDGRTCEVKRVYYKLSNKRDDDGKLKYIILVPTVRAVLLER